jgi:hypothetical protein
MAFERDEPSADVVRPLTEPGGPLERIFGTDGDRKGWGRASIRLRTHPLHRFPRITQDDLLLPHRPDLLRLAGDCVVIGALFALLAFFPLLLVSLAVTTDLSGWIVGSMAAVGLSTALYVFVRAWSPDTRDLDRF